MIIDQKYYRETYSSIFLQELKSRYQILESTDDLRNRLEDFAAIYRWENDKYETRQPNSETKREILALVKQLARTNHRLKALSQDASHRLRWGIDTLQMTHLFHKRRGEYCPFIVPCDDSTNHLLGLPHFQQMVSSLEQEASKLADQIGPSKSGRGRD